RPTSPSAARAWGTGPARPFHSPGNYASRSPTIAAGAIALPIPAVAGLRPRRRKPPRIVATPTAARADAASSVPSSAATVADDAGDRKTFGRVAPRRHSHRRRLLGQPRTGRLGRDPQLPRSREGTQRRR